MFAQSGWGGFVGVAAMLALLASLGGKSGGGGGGGPSPKDTQAAAGAGGVLGDSSAKSKTLENAAGLLDKDIENSRKMLMALESIERNIGGLSSAIARQMGVSGGMFDTSGLGIGTTPGKGSPIPLDFISMQLPKLASSVWGSIRGGKVTTSLADLGFTFGEQTVGQAAAGIDANTYQTTTSKKDGGWFKKDKITTATTVGELASEVSRWLTQTIDSLRGGVVTAAGVLGLDGAQATIDSMNLGLSKISIKGLTGEEITEQLEAVMGKLFDDMALAVAPELLRLSKVGEGAGETMARLANTLTVVNGTIGLVDGRLFDISVAGAAAATGLAEAFGGLDNLKDSLGSYYDKFYTEAEKTANLTTQASGAFARMGIVMPKVDDGMRQWYRSEVDRVSALDMGVAANAAAYVGIVSMADLMDELSPSFDAAADAARELAEINRGWQDQLDVLAGKETNRSLALRDATDDSTRALMKQVYAQQDAKTAIDAMTASLTSDGFTNVFDFRRAQANAANPQAGTPTVYTSTGVKVSSNSAEASGGNSAALVAEIAALRVELKAAQISQISSAKTTENIFVKWENDGMPAVRVVAS